QYTHSKHLCNADISMENILVSSARDTPFVIDFGMAFRMPHNEQGRRYRLNWLYFVH
ncbi:unnamed protein product, partial [Choristocarpus tenellus]